jgi:uncharacterized pyridoxamine 5'-phosphate oxidase family protein
VFAKANRFLISQDKVPFHSQAVGEQVMHMILQLTIKVYKHIAAKNKLEFVEGTINCQIVMRENKIFQQRFIQVGAVLFTREILMKRLYST